MQHGATKRATPPFAAVASKLCLADEMQQPVCGHSGSVKTSKFTDGVLIDDFTKFCCYAVADQEEACTAQCQ